MLSRRLIVALSLGYLLIGFNAEAGCPKGSQPWTRTTSGDTVCLPDRMVAYLACLETTGGGLITVDRNDAAGSSKKVSVGLEGGGGTLLAKGKGKITVDVEKSDAAIKQLKAQFDPKNNTKCFNAAFSGSPIAPQKPPKQAKNIQESSSADPLFPKLVGNDVVFQAEDLERTTPGFKSGGKFYIAFHKNGWNPNEGNKRYEMQREGDKLIAKGVINQRFHPVLVSPRRWHKIERAYPEYLPTSGEFKNNIDYTNPDGPCYCFGPNCVPYNKGGQ